MAAKVRFGIVGSGFVARTHAEALRTIDDAEAVMISGGRNAGETAREYDLRHERDVERLLTASEVDAVVICSPHAYHAEQAITALNAGKHVLVEKPMACSEDECLRMIAAAKTARRALMVAHFQRFRAPNAAVRAAIAAGRIGRVRTVQQRLLEAPNEKPWQLDPASKGFFLGYGVHGIDLLRWWLDSEVATIYAKCSRFRDNPTEDGTQAVLHFTSGATGSILATDSLPVAKRNAAPGAAGLVSLIIGDAGVITVDSYDEALLETRDGREVIGKLPTWDSLTSPERIQAYREQDESFIRTIVDGTPVAISGNEGMKNVVVALGAYASSERGEAITIINRGEQDEQT